MLHVEDPVIRDYMLRGNIGLEKESFRIDTDGFIARTPHPFEGSDKIVRDFSESQTEINTNVTGSAEEAVRALSESYMQLQKELAGKKELLWPFSNAPVIRSEEDIPIAVFTGAEKSKTLYRRYLARKYGRYLMSFCGIHFNYSFDDRLMRREAQLEGAGDYATFCDRFYAELAEKAAAYGWLITALTAASPLQDISYAVQGESGHDLFSGMASVRCSESGYWNSFTPVLDYSSVGAYSAGIQKLVDEKLIAAPSELYYPVRIKPRGRNSLEALENTGVSHIELRMFDLNPLVPAGIDVRDVTFAQLFLIWLGGGERVALTAHDQVQAMQNFKNAAHFDLRTVHITTPGGKEGTAQEIGLVLLDRIRAFYRDFPDEIQDILSFEENKFRSMENRYAFQVRELFHDTFVQKGLELAVKRQEQACLWKEL